MTALSKSQRRWLDIASRALAALGFAYLLWRAALENLAGRRPLLFLLVGEALTLVLVVIARPTDEVDRRLQPAILTFFGTFYFSFVDVAPGGVLIPVLAGQSLQVIGIAFQVAAKLWLGRSFGLLPANRGIVTKGPYRLVRHPIYLGYFLNHVGFLLVNFSFRNLMVYAWLYAIQIARIFEEEKLLFEDAQYRAYAERVRYRFIPLAF